MKKKRADLRAALATLEIVSLMRAAITEAVRQHLANDEDEVPRLTRRIAASLDSMRKMSGMPRWPELGKSDHAEKIVCLTIWAIAIIIEGSKARQGALLLISRSLRTAPHPAEQPQIGPRRVLLTRCPWEPVLQGLEKRLRQPQGTVPYCVDEEQLMLKLHS